MSLSNKFRIHSSVGLPSISTIALSAVLCFSSLATLQQSSVQARNTNGISSIALSPDGSTLYAGGSNLVVYKLDPETLKVVSRHWVKHKSIDMAISADGKYLMIQDYHDVVRVYDAKTMKLKKKIRKAKQFSYAKKANKIVVATYGYAYKEKTYYTTVRVINGSTFKEEKKFKVKGQAADLVPNPSASIISIITKPIKTPEEKKEDTTSDMSYSERAEFRQKHDEKTSEHIVINVADGKVTRNVSWFSMWGDAFMVRSKDGVAVFPASSTGGAFIKDSGETTFIATGDNTLYGAYYEFGESRVIAGNTNAITVKSADDEEVTQYKLKKLPNYDYPDYIIKGTDTYFAATRQFRVLRFDPVEGIDKVAPVY